MWQKMKKMKKILVQKLYHNGIIRETGDSRSVAVFEFAASVVWDVPQFIL